MRAIFNYAGGMKIYVRPEHTLKAAIFILDVESSDLIESVKDKIVKIEGIPSKYEILMFNGKILHDGKTLSDYNIVDGSTISLTVNESFHLIFGPDGGFHG